MRRWVCPGCDGGKLAPERPRRNDVRRYCLACSEKTGVLVERERVCVAAEKRRAHKRTRAAAKRKQARDHTLAQASHYPQTLRTLFKKWSRHPVWGVDLRDVDFRLRRGRDTHSSGLAWFNYFVVTAGTNEVDGLRTLVHEMAHVACMRRRIDDGHGDKWRGLFVDAMRQLCPEVPVE